MTYIYDFTDPFVAVKLVAVNNPKLYQTLTLQCSATIVRGISGTIDIIWTTGDIQVRSINNITASIHLNSTSIFYDSFIIPTLKISDIGSIYHCEVLINSTVPTVFKESIVIPIPGMYLYRLCVT